MTDVRRGVAVNIVLKADQATGKTVRGSVKDVLTRGDHPRGIKVRLMDGRIGRVQSLATGDAVEQTAVGEPSAPPEGKVTDIPDGPLSSDTRYRQGRQEEESRENLPVEQVGLDAFIKPGRSPRQGKRKGRAIDISEPQSSNADPIPNRSSPTESTTCPVCGEFEGDETAVAHHVATHFGPE